jgi:hypothetical protein
MTTLNKKATNRPVACYLTLDNAISGVPSWPIRRVVSIFRMEMFSKTPTRVQLDSLSMGLSETSVNLYQTIRHHIPNDITPSHTEIIRRVNQIVRLPVVWNPKTDL